VCNCIRTRCAVCCVQEIGVGVEEQGELITVSLCGRTEALID